MRRRKFDIPNDSHQPTEPETGPASRPIAESHGPVFVSGRRPSGFVFFLLAILVASLTAIVAGHSLLSWTHLPAYRDSGHYYAPLYRWQSLSYSASEGSLWDPHENLGRSLASDPTAASFYPPAIAMRVLPGPWPLRFNLYLMSHLLIAALGAIWGARRLGIRGPAALLAGLVYASAGAVVTQISNPVFLVGAAWLPWNLAAGWHAMQSRSLASVSIASLALGLMILGGDPQSATHAVMALALIVVGRSSRRSKRMNARDSVSATHWLSQGPLGIPAAIVSLLAARRQTLLTLAAIVLAGGLVAAVQLVPSLQAAATSDRRVHREPRSLYEGIRDLTRSDVPVPAERVARVTQGWFGAPLPGTHHAASLEFSLAPWQLAELLWPNSTGQSVGQYERWIDGIPAADRAWFPSIYVGAIPLIVGLAGLSRRKTQAGRWLFWSALLFTLLAFGWYGIGWIAQEAIQAWRGERVEAWWSPALGGLYWFAQLLVPGYADFRFPAKAFVVATLFASWIAADELSKPSLRRVTRWSQVAAGLAALSFVAMSVSWWQESSFREWCKSIPTDGTFGPFQVDGAWNSLQTGLAHGLIATTLLWGLAAAFVSVLRRSTSNTPSRALRRRVVAMAATILLIDLAIAHYSLIEMAPNSIWNSPSPLLAHVDDSAETTDISSAVNDNKIVGAAAAVQSMPRVYRGYWNGWTPEPWWTTSSPDRMQEVVAWDRATWFPKHHRWDAVRLIEAPGSSQDSTFWMLMQVARYHGWTRSDGAQEPSMAVLNALGAEWIVVPSWDQSRWQQIQPTLIPIEPTEEWPVSTTLFQNPDAFEETWIVERAVSHPRPAMTDDLDALWKWIDRGLQHPEAGVHAWREAVLLDVPNIESLASSDNPSENSASSAKIVWHSHHRVELDVQTQSSGWLVLAHAYDPAWRVQVLNASGEWEPRELHRANFVMRAVELRAGDQKVWMEYSPPFASLSGCTSLMSSLLCLLIVFGPWRRKF